MTSIDSTAIPEHLSEEYLDAVIEDAETYISKLSQPKIVLMTPQYADSTALPSASISGRTITFALTSFNGSDAFPTPVGYYVLIKGRR